MDKTKKIIKSEKCVTQVKRSEVSLLIKTRSRMLNLKNNFKGQFKGDVSCLRCDLGIDDENHVFARFQDVLENINLEKLRKVVWFLREANLESWDV